MNRKQKGFTLVEIIVVLVIITILAAIAVPSVTSYIKETEKVKFVNASDVLFDEIQVNIEKAFMTGSSTNAIESLKKIYSVKNGNTVNVGEDYIPDFKVNEVVLCFDDNYTEPWTLNTNQTKHKLSKITFIFQHKTNRATWKYLVLVPGEEMYWYPTYEYVDDPKAQITYYW